MKATIRRALEARKAQREENGEAGFSLIELIVVVVILGILAAVAIPIFLGLQDQAKKGALESIVGNGASQVASDIAQNKTDKEIADSLKALADQSVKQLTGIVLTLTPATGATIDKFCVSGTSTDVKLATGEKIEAGPGCVATP